MTFRKLLPTKGVLWFTRRQTICPTPHFYYYYYYLTLCLTRSTLYQLQGGRGRKNRSSWVEIGSYPTCAGLWNTR